MSIQRFDCELASHYYGEPRAEMIESQLGDYVEYTEYVKRVQDADILIMRLIRACSCKSDDHREEWSKDYKAWLKRVDLDDLIA